MNDKLREHREMLDKSTDEMARLIGVSNSYYVKIERGERQPGYGFLTKFAKAFPMVDIDRIFFDN